VFEVAGCAKTFVVAGDDFSLRINYIEGIVRFILSGEAMGASENNPKVQLIGEFMAEMAISHALWLLDSPVSNSGRLKTLIAEVAHKRGWHWDIRLTISPDAELRTTETIVISTDSVILDVCPRWTNLAGEIIARKLPAATVIDMVAE